MSYSMEEKYHHLFEGLKKYTSKNPLVISKALMKEDFINMHGPEHHLLDGGSFLVAYHQVTHNFDIDEALQKFSERSIKMPGAMCGFWGVCGAVTSLGAALSVIHETSPLSKDEYYKDHMAFTSRVLAKMSAIGGPRCCKRNGFLTLLSAIDFVKEKYGVELEKQKHMICEFSEKNPTCLKNKCPFFPQ